jgi:hypothetical protein
MPSKTAHDILQSSHTPSPNTKSPEQLDRYNDRPGRIPELQEQIRDDRETLLGSRFRLRSNRHELRKTRENAANQAGTAFNLVKRFLLEQSFELPHDIQAALEAAELSSDRLGVQEVEYEESEERYNLEEWRYTEREQKFVDNLLGSTPVASAPPPPAHGSLGTHDLTQLFIDGAENDDAPTVPELLPLPPNISDLDLPTMPPLEGKASVTFQQPLVAKHIPTSTSYIESSMTHPENEPLCRRSFSESELDHARLRWFDTRTRVEEWLLDNLEGSRLQRAQLRLHLSRGVSDDEAWWQLVLQHWKSESRGSITFQTGDTTVSGSIGNQPTFDDVDPSNAPEDSGTDGFYARPSFASPLLGNDRVVDALDAEEFPPTIRSSDLFDQASKHVTFETRSPSAQSLSTQPTTATRRSSAVDFSSVSSTNDVSSCTSSGDANTVRQRDLSETYEVQPGEEKNRVSEPSRSESENHSSSIAITTTTGIDDLSAAASAVLSHTGASHPVHEDPRAGTSVSPEPVHRSKLSTPRTKSWYGRLFSWKSLSGTG